MCPNRGGGGERSGIAEVNRSEVNPYHPGRIKEEERPRLKEPRTGLKETRTTSIIESIHIIVIIIIIIVIIIIDIVIIINIIVVIIIIIIISIIYEVKVLTCKCRCFY